MDLEFVLKSEASQHTHVKGDLTIGQKVDKGNWWRIAATGATYEARVPHVAEASVSWPETGSDWETYWKPTARGAQGIQGIPGGTMQWRGPYDPSHNYMANDGVSGPDGNGYYSMVDNNLGNDPASNPDKWSKFAGAPRISWINFIISGFGAAITAGLAPGCLTLPQCTIKAVRLLGDVSGSIVVDIWKCSYAQFDPGGSHPVDADSITASAPPMISSAKKSEDTTLAGWITSVNAGDVLAFNVDSCSSITVCVLAMKIEIP